MVNYLCPFCYVPPVQNINPSPDVCFRCKNTDNLRSLALWQEIQLISDKIQDFHKVSADLEKINDTLAKRALPLNDVLSTEAKIGNQEDSMKKIEEELKELAKNFEYQTKMLEQSKALTSAPELQKLENVCEQLICETGEAKPYASICAS